LILAGCGLTDFSIKKLTLPYRLYQNANKMEILDLESK